MRNATLEDLVARLRDEQPRKLDVVVPAEKIRFNEGALLLQGVDPILADDGVDDPNGSYCPARVALDAIAAKLDIPARYLRRTHEELPGLFDDTANGWLRWQVEQAGKSGKPAPSYMLRMLRGKDGGDGILRSVSSDRYKIIDNLDVLLAALDGIRQAGVSVSIDGCDLTEKRMYVRMWSPEVQALAPDLLRGYRSPFDAGIRRAGDSGWTIDSARRAAAGEGQAFEPGTEPVVFAGFEIRNSEVGQGRYAVTPRILVKVCRNGLVLPLDAVEATHVGVRLDAGVVGYSGDTMDKALALITAQTRDGVQAFLDGAYLVKRVEELEREAGTPVQDPERAIQVLARSARIDQARQDEILKHFLIGGQLTAGGVMQAVSSVAQTQTDADMAAELEALALRAMREVAHAGV